MTTLASPPLGSSVARPGVTFGRVLRCEWTKLWTLRSTRWTLLLSFIAMAALGPIVAAFQMSRWGQVNTHDRLVFDSIDTGIGGWHLAQLGIGVLGVLVISGEYTTGMIRSSLMAVPRRLPVLWAKCLVFAAVTFVLMLVASAISFFAVQAIVTQHHVQHGIGDPGALRTLLGSALFLTVLSVLCVGLGGLVRNSAGGIASFVGLLFVLPGISAILPARINDAVSPYLPLSAGTTITSHRFDNPHHLAIWAGFAVFCGYAALALAAASVTLLRRDA